jgi:hypothetical protein
MVGETNHRLWEQKPMIGRTNLLVVGKKSRDVGTNLLLWEQKIWLREQKYMGTKKLCVNGVIWLAVQYRCTIGRSHERSHLPGAII